MEIALSIIFGLITFLSFGYAVYQARRAKKAENEINDIKFHKAIKYEIEKENNDLKRIKAIFILYDQYKINTNDLVENKELFSKYYSMEMKKEIETNYNSAIDGEKAREL